MVHSKAEKTSLKYYKLFATLNTAHKEQKVMRVSDVAIL